MENVAPIKLNILKKYKCIQNSYHNHSKYLRVGYFVFLMFLSAALENRMFSSGVGIFEAVDHRNGQNHSLMSKWLLQRKGSD